MQGQVILNSLHGLLGLHAIFGLHSGQTLLAPALRRARNGEGIPLGPRRGLLGPALRGLGPGGPVCAAHHYIGDQHGERGVGGVVVQAHVGEHHALLRGLHHGLHHEKATRVERVVHLEVRRHPLHEAGRRDLDLGPLEHAAGPGEGHALYTSLAFHQWDGVCFTAQI